MLDSHIARPYAKAIISLALENNALAKWRDLLQTLGYIASQAKVKKMLKNPNFNYEARADFFINSCQEMLDESTKNFIYLLASKNRLVFLPKIYDLFSGMCAELAKTTNVTVVSAGQLQRAQQQKLMAALTKKLHSEINITYQIAPQILGGIIIKIGDLVIDGSVNGKLVKLKKFLNKR